MLESAIALGLLIYWFCNSNDAVLIASGLFAIASNILFIAEKGKKE